MKQAIPLGQPTQNNGSSAVHATALVLFQWVRSAAELAAEVPDLAQQAASDVAQAWRDSANPKR